MESTTMVCAEDARVLPDEVADAWAAVLIDVYERCQEQTEAEHGDAAA